MKKYLWFKRKTYGYGWTPVTWQGWLVLVVWLIPVLGPAFTLNKNASLKQVTFTFFIPLILLTALLIYICYKTGEKPRWQWGEPKDKK